jgi:hypothetical protein
LPNRCVPIFSLETSSKEPKAIEEAKQGEKFELLSAT